MLERRGEGWGEEVLPHVSFVRRPNRRRDKRKDSGSVHVLLTNCGLAPDVVADVVARATAWRVRQGGCVLAACTLADVSGTTWSPLHSIRA